MPSRIRCHVIEVPTQDDWLARRGGGPRELLPWADPYIAALMNKLEGNSDCSGFTCMGPDKCGVRMPQAQPPLEDAQIELIRAWIKKGAPM